MCGGMEVWRHGDDGVLIDVDFSLVSDDGGDGGWVVMVAVGL